MAALTNIDKYKFYDCYAFGELKLYQYKMPPLSIIIIFMLKYILSDINLGTPSYGYCYFEHLCVFIFKVNLL